MRFVLYSPAQARLKAKGEYSIKRSLGEMIDLPTQAEKFSVSPFSKGDDFGDFSKKSQSEAARWVSKNS
jgi:hypothetical protein